MSIPVENIYYLLCYAWNKLEEKERVNVSTDGLTNQLDLFSKVLINGCRVILKRGIHKNYREETHEIVGVKGKIEFSDTLKRNLLFKQKTISTFDVFSSSVLINQIIASTINNLLMIKKLDRSLKYELLFIKRMLGEIKPIKLSNSIFKRIRFHRNNQFYEFIINVCQIIYEGMLPSEDNGEYVFKDFTKDQRKMANLFESFVRNFYKIEQNKFHIVKSEKINWKLNSENYDCFLPEMKTDITLENDDKKIIIDTKYYKEVMNSYHNKEKIYSSNLYQIFSYLINQENHSEKSKVATGILLYPTINKEHDLDYKFEGHSIQIKTINLNANWKNIAYRLKNIIDY